MAVAAAWAPATYRTGGKRTEQQMDFLEAVVYAETMSSMCLEWTLISEASATLDIARRVATTHTKLREMVDSRAQHAQEMKDILVELRDALAADASPRSSVEEDCWQRVRETAILWLPLAAPPGLDVDEKKKGDEDDASADSQSTAESCSGRGTPRNRADSTASSFGSCLSRQSTVGTRSDDQSCEIDFERIASGQETRTTCLIRNLPGKLTEQGLLQAMEAVTCGQLTSSSVEQVKLPVCRSGKGIGFAFLQFRSAEDVAVFAKAFHNYSWPTLYSCKVSEVVYSKVQGLSAAARNEFLQ